MNTEHNKNCIFVSILAKLGLLIFINCVNEIDVLELFDIDFCRGVRILLSEEYISK